MLVFPYLMLSGWHHFYMRSPENADYPFIADWMARNTGLLGSEKERIRILLLEHLLDTASICRHHSRVGIYDGQLIFYLELAGYVEMYVTINPEVQA